MKVYIANAGDTLRTLSLRYDAALEELILLNPNVRGPDSDIAGKHIKIPQRADSTGYRMGGTYCPDVPVYKEQWIPLTSLEKMEQTDYDVLIVGTGAGGGAVLWRLCEQWGKNGKRVGIIEAGDLLLPTNGQNIATMDPERFLKYFYSVAKSPSQYPSPQLAALGGRTLFWTNVCPRMHASETAGWPVTAKEMDFYYNLAEKVMNVTYSFTKGSPLTQIMLNRLQKNGFPETTDEPIAIDLEPTKFGVVNSNPFFSSIAFLAQAMNRPFDLAVKARAVQVYTEKNKVVGVKVMSPDKRTYFLKAKTVVLSASTFGTPLILLNSGIQGSAVGHYLTNHSRLVGTGTVKRSQFPEMLGPLRVLIPGTENRPYQVQIWGPGNYAWVQFKEEPLQDKWGVKFYGSGKVESRYDNRVALDPVKRDEYGVPEIQVHFAYSKQDEIIMNQMAAGIMEASAAMKTPLNLRDGRPDICLMPPGLENHEIGTCRMGDDPFTSAADRYGQIHGVHGLFAADNSVIPTSGTANPTLTAVALAVRTADYIIQQLK
ncbi:MAG TPA: GMC oxidoreductase [Candidatus Udaeobacter sp.]|nr:GMC oxidoreductase [Candidatus Udaeobacter sp.]